MTSTTIEAQIKELDLHKRVAGKAYPTANGGLSNIHFESCEREVLNLIAKAIEAEKLKGQIEAVNEFMNKLNREHFDEPIGTPAQYVTQKLLEFTSSLQQQLDSIEKPESK